MFCWSFLQGHTTTLRLPNHDSVPYWLGIGIPQGSPLSPILFLLFISGLLEVLDRNSNLHDINAECYPFGYVDDHYLVVISPDYETNCRAFERMTEVLKRWADENKVVFNPKKYVVMHFRRPRSRDKRSQERNALREKRSKGRANKSKGGPKAVAKDHDNDNNNDDDEPTTFSPISDEIPRIDGVHGKMRTMWRMGGATWGISLVHMRQWYLTTVRPMITYGCQAWFLPPAAKNLKWRLTQKLMAQLESLQYQCLLQVSGAMRNTPRHMLLKELGIPSLEVYMTSLVMKHAAYMINTPEHSELERIRQLPMYKKCCYRAHPFHCLFTYAAILRHCAREEWLLSKFPGSNGGLGRKQTKKAISNYFSRMEDAQASSEWADYAKAHRHINHPLYKEKWSGKNFQLYRGMDRRTSTMLLHCRTNCIGLRWHLHKRFNITNDEVPDEKCPCDGGPHTPHHLFVECANLAEARIPLKAQLRAQLNGRLDTLTLWTSLGRAGPAAVLSQWAIENFARRREP
ncbi:unnamed protein product [Clonostachys rhizophaga]|uniref:Reverse transcriptase domain-containing protein n=1 Tax=Clonostachys rhizophaga TaxID=160324 RepID=A0A9N9VY07_9HYPO|nr:unnamed protein product [Clonostachys rhizophaga]